MEYYTCIDNLNLFEADLYLVLFMDFFSLDLDQILHSAPRDPQPNLHLHSDQKHPLSSRLGPQRKPTIMVYIPYMYMSFSENTCVFWNNCLFIVIKSDNCYWMNISLFVCVDVKRPPPIVRKPMSSQSIKRIKTKQEDTKVRVLFITFLIILKYHRMYVKNKVTFWYSDLPLS